MLIVHYPSSMQAYVSVRFFAFLHIKAFSYKPYCPVESASAKGYPLHLKCTPRLRSLGHALDFRETLREVWSGCVYIMRRFRGQETDRGARRLAAREEVFGARDWGKGQSRRLDEELVLTTEKHELGPELQGMKIAVDVKQEVHIDEEMQWLGSGDGYANGLILSRRERSAGLEEQIQLELERRGLPRIMREKSRAKASGRGLPEDSGLLLPEEWREIGHGKQRSWWRNVYDRISGTSRDNHSDNGLHENANLDSGIARKPSRRVSFKTKLTLDREIGEGDTYARLPTVESYNELLPPSRPLGHERSMHQPRIAPNSYRPPNVLHMSMGPPTPGDDCDQQLSFDLRLPKHKPPGRNAEGQIASRQPDLRLSPNVDHVLSRLFSSSPPKSDAGTSTSPSMALSTNPSSQTHSDSDRRYLRLVPPAQIVSKDTIALRTPVVVHEEGHGQLRVDDARRKRERSRTAIVEEVNSEPTPRHHLSSSREETRVDGEGPSAMLNPPPGLNLAPLARESTGSLRHELGPRGPRVPKPRIVLPAPLALELAPTDRSQQDVTTMKTSTATGHLPEIRISLFPPARRKAVPQYHGTTLPMAVNNKLTETQANSSVLAALSVDSQVSVAEIGPSETVETREQQSQQRPLTLTSVQEEMVTGAKGVPPGRMTSPSGLPNILTTESSTAVSYPKLPSRDSPSTPIVPNASLQRGGAQAVRRSSAPLPPRGSPALEKFSHRPLVSGPTTEMQRARRSKHRSPHHFYFPRHNVTGHPIAQETFEANSLRNAHRMFVPSGPSPSQSRRITSSRAIPGGHNTHDIHDLTT